METLPGIAHVLRSPVADAFVNLIRAGVRIRDFDMADAEEILKYAVRRNLMAQDEADRVTTEAKSAMEKRAERAAEREKNRKIAKVVPLPKPVVVKHEVKPAARQEKVKPVKAEVKKVMAAAKKPAPKANHKKKK
ncbi:MAG: hypothetical protein ABI647_25305 [Gemmatimonadota bacterium]